MCILRYMDLIEEIYKISEKIENKFSKLPTKINYGLELPEIVILRNRPNAENDLREFADVCKVKNSKEGVQYLSLRVGDLVLYDFETVSKNYQTIPITVERFNTLLERKVKFGDLNLLPLK